MEKTAESKLRDAHILGTTAKGKNVLWVRAEPFNTLRIKFEGGGQLPKELSGRWTDVNAAQRAVKRYLDKQLRAKENAAEKAADKSLQF